MNQNVTRFVFNYLVRPPLLVVGFVVRAVYWLLYGWWGEKRGEQRFLALQQEELEREILDRFSFLFATRGAEIIPTTDLGHLADLKCSVVTVGVEDLLLRFVRWRDNEQLHVAAKQSPKEWHELSAVLNAIEPNRFSRHSVLSFEDASRLLKDNMDVLREAFSAGRYSDLRNELEEAHRGDVAVTRQVQDDINRILYPNR